MKSDPKSETKTVDKVVTVEPGAPGADPVSGITEQLTIAEMENVTTVFRSGVNVTSISLSLSILSLNLL